MTNTLILLVLVKMFRTYVYDTYNFLKKINVISQLLVGSDVTIRMNFINLHYPLTM